MAAAKTLAPVKSKDPQLSSTKGSVSSVGREDTFPVDKPAEKESTFTVDSTEKTKEKTRALEERRRSQLTSNSADDINTIQSKMAKGKDKDKGKKDKDGDKKGSDAKKPGSDGKDPPKDNTCSSKDNDKDKQDDKKTNSENEKPDASAAGNSEKQTDSKTNDNTPTENKGEKDDPAKKPDAADDQGSAMGNNPSTEDDKKQMSSSQGSLGSKSRRNSFLNAKHVTSISLRKDANDADGSRRGSAVSGKDGKENPDSQKDVGEKPAETDTKEPDTVIESPKGGPTLDEAGKDESKDKGEEKVADEPKPEEKERTGADSETKGKADDGDENNEENKDNTDNSVKKDVNDLGDGDKSKPEESASPVVPPEKQKEPEKEVKEEAKDDTKTPADTGVKEEEKPPTPKPTPEPKQEPEPEKEETKKEAENDDKADDTNEKKKESDNTPEKDQEAEKSSEKELEKEPGPPSEDTSRKADETKPESVEKDEKAGEDVQKNSDRTEGDPRVSNSDDEVDNTQSRENTDIEGEEETGDKEEDPRKEPVKDEKEREPTPRKRPTPTPRTPKSKERNVPNHPSSRPTQKETSETIMRERTPVREPQRRRRSKDYPGKPTRVENPPKKGTSKNTPREENEPPPDNTKYKPKRKISDMSESDTNQGRGRSNRGERDTKKPFGRSSQMGPARKRQSYSDDPNSDLEMRTPRSKPRRSPQPYTTKSPRYEGSKASPRYERSPRSNGVPKRSPRYKPPSPELEESDSSDPFLKFDRNSENLADLEKDTLNVLDVIRNMQDENRRAMSENSKLREKNMKLHQTVGELRGEMDELYEEKEEAERRLAEEGKKENYVRKLEKDVMNAEHDRQKYLAKIQVLEDESRKQQRRIADKDTEISVAIGELQQLQRENEKLLTERMTLSSQSPRHQRHRVAVTEVSDAGTQTFHSEMNTDGDIGMVDILKQEVKSLKDYNSHIQRSLREEMSRRELVQSLLDDVMTTNEGFRKHVVKIADRDSEVDSLTKQLREMEVSQRKMMTENTQLKASLSLLEAQKQKDDAIEEILTGRSSKRDKSLEKRLEEMEQKLRISEHRVVDLEGYLDQIYNNDDVKIVIRSDPRSNVTDTSIPNGLPALPGVYPDRNQPSAFTKIDLNAYNSYARLSKNKTRFSKRF